MNPFINKNIGKLETRSHHCIRKMHESQMKHNTATKTEGKRILKNLMKDKVVCTVYTT